MLTGQQDVFVKTSWLTVQKMTFYLWLTLRMQEASVHSLQHSFKLFTDVVHNLHKYYTFFLICIVGGGIKVHSTLRPLNGLLCQPWVIMIMEKSVE
jgi:hypothetical protein